jgi:hypothetical protein
MTKTIIFRSDPNPVIKMVKSYNIVNIEDELLHLWTFKTPTFLKIDL